MKIDTADVKRGVILKIDGNLYKVVETGHTHMGRGGATYNFKVKNVITGATNTYTYKSGQILESADVATQSAIYLYRSGDIYSFMEHDTSTMFDINESDISDIVPYLKENLDVYLMINEDKVIGVLLPQTVSYTITSTVPGIKGDRAQAGKKPAVLETGMEIQVPLHKNEGDVVVVNTVTGDAA